jgi:hypothetical protein
MLLRSEAEDHVVWTAVLNGETCKFVTTDPSLMVRARGVAFNKVVGVELVDQEDTCLAWAIRYLP